MNLPMFTYAEVCEVKEISTDVLGENAVKLLEKGYSEYYKFCSYDTALAERNIDGNIVEEIFYLEISAILLADSVDDLDFYNGIQEYWNVGVSANAATMGRSFEQAAKYTAIITTTKNALQDSFEEYIGKEQPLKFFVKATYEMGNYNTASFLFENGEEYVGAEGMYPPTREELKARGYAMMEYYSDVALSEASKMAGTKAADFSYNNTAAVAYAVKYTSNPSSCSFHQKNCGKYVDTTKYNSAYANYASTHTDCANYISQCLHAGGIPTDATWYAGSLAWINVSELCNYMLNNRYWREISYLMPPVGAYMRYTNQSHIVMLSSHDGVTYKYSGHTNDRLNFVISLSSSNKYYFINFN